MKFFFSGDTIDKAGVYLGEITHGFCFAYTESICFKENLLVAKPGNQCAQFGRVFEMVQCVISVYGASKSDMTGFGISRLFPFISKVLLELFFGGRECVSGNNQCTLPVDRSDGNTMVEISEGHKEGLCLWDRIICSGVFFWYWVL